MTFSLYYGCSKVPNFCPVNKVSIVWRRAYYILSNTSHEVVGWSQAGSLILGQSPWHPSLTYKLFLPWRWKTILRNGYFKWLTCNLAKAVVFVTCNVFIRQNQSFKSTQWSLSHSFGVSGIPTLELHYYFRVSVASWTICDIVPRLFFGRLFIWYWDCYMIFYKAWWYLWRNIVGRYLLHIWTENESKDLYTFFE